VEEQPEAVGDAGGPSTPHDGDDNVRDIAEGHSDMANGNQNRKV
jgi:hypothetical protein